MLNRGTICRLKTEDRIKTTIDLGRGLHTGHTEVIVDEYTHRSYYFKAYKPLQHNRGHGIHKNINAVSWFEIEHISQANELRGIEHDDTSV